MRLNINENGVNVIWMVVNILIHLLTEILAYCKALKVKISVHSNFPYRFAHSASGGYMFPDLEKGNIAGGAVGLLIPESVTEVDR